MARFITPIPRKEITHNERGSRIISIKPGVFYFNVISATLLTVILKSSYLFTVLGISVFSFSLGATVVFLFTERFARLNRDSALRFFALLTGASFIFCILVAYWINDVINLHIDSIAANGATIQFVSKWLGIHQSAAYFLGVDFGIPFFVYGIFLSYLFLGAAAGEFSQFCLSEFLGGAVGTLMAATLTTGGFPAMIAIPPAACFAGAVILGEKSWPLRRKTLRRLSMGLVALFLMAYAVGPFVEPKPETNVLARNFERKFEVTEVWTGWTTYSRASLLELRTPGSDWIENIVALGSGEGHAAIHHYTPGQPTYTAFPAQLALSLGVPKRVLVLFGGAGRDLVELESRFPGKIDLTAVELNEKVWEAAFRAPHARLKEFFQLPNVHMILSDNRSFWNAITVNSDSIIYSFSGVTIAYLTGTVAHTSQFSYTCDAIQRVLEHLNPGGFTVVMDGNKMNLISCLRDTIKGNVADMTAILAQGQGHPLEIADNYSVIIKPSGLTRADVNKLKHFEDKQR